MEDVARCQIVKSIGIFVVAVTSPSVSAFVAAILEGPAVENSKINDVRCWGFFLRALKCLDKFASRIHIETKHSPPENQALRVSKAD